MTTGPHSLTDLPETADILDMRNSGAAQRARDHGAVARIARAGTGTGGEERLVAVVQVQRPAPVAPRCSSPAT